MPEVVSTLFEDALTIAGGLVAIAAIVFMLLVLQISYVVKIRADNRGDDLGVLRGVVRRRRPAYGANESAPLAAPDATDTDLRSQRVDRERKD